MREQPDGDFVVNYNYQVVYRRLFEAQRKCYRRGDRGVRGQLYNDIQEGEISVSLLSQGWYFLYTDIKALSESTTRVVVYCKEWNIARESVLSMLELWANGKECDCKG